MAENTKLTSAASPTTALTMPMIRLRPMATPLPVPRCAEGKTCMVDRVSNDGENIIQGWMTIRGTYLGRVGVKCAVVNIKAERDGACEPKVLARGPHLGVAEEEDHGDQGTDNHGSPSTPEPARATHKACENWTKN